MRRLLALSVLSISLLGAPWAVRPRKLQTAVAPTFQAAVGTAPRRGPRRPMVQLPYQVGMASWYGQFFQGKTTTSGVPFNMWAMTAAHRTLPLGTRVRVTNLENHLAVILRINDRGPVPESRIIDLSYGAARVLDFTGQGLTPVRIDILPPHGRLGVTAAPNPL